MKGQLIVRRDVTHPTKPPRLPIHGSTARAEIATSRPSSSSLGVGPFGKVRCGSCDRRLLDVHREYQLSDGFDQIPDGSLLVERKCPSCHRLNVGCVTIHDGRPFTGQRALAGPWRCECGHSLGAVDDVRGRICVTCRCKVEARVVVAEVIAVVEQEPN
jgi:hypothetical protein